MKEIIDNLLKFLADNQVLLTALGLGGAGTIVFWLKGIPLTIYNFVKREFTTELHITSQNRIFFEVLKFVEKEYKNRNFRRLKLTNGKWGNDDNTLMSLGYGNHIIRYRGRFLIVNLQKVDANQTNLDKEEISFLKLGRSHKLFIKLVEDAEKAREEQVGNRIYKMDSSWEYVKDQKKRPLDSVFMEKFKKDQLLKALDDFMKGEKWYIDHGVPYQLGILLYGPPGTGKTSLIKAIASYLNYDIYYIPVSRLYRIEEANSTLPDKCLMVVEDIDSNFITQRRPGEEETENSALPRKGKPPVGNKPKSIDESILSSMGEVSLSELLNSLDGIFSAHGRILVATTNYIDRLDKALIRPGRFDIKIEIGFVNHEILNIFFSSFFPEDQISVDASMPIKSTLTIAELQNKILVGMESREILSYCLTPQSAPTAPPQTHPSSHPHPGP